MNKCKMCQAESENIQIVERTTQYSKEKIPCCYVCRTLFKYGLAGVQNMTQQCFLKITREEKYLILNGMQATQTTNKEKATIMPGKEFLDYFMHLAVNEPSKMKLIELHAAGFAKMLGERKDD